MTERLDYQSPADKPREAKEATLQIKLKVDSGFESESTHRISVDQWADINIILEGESVTRSAGTASTEAVAWRYRTRSTDGHWSMWVVTSELPGDSGFEQEIEPLFARSASVAPRWLVRAGGDAYETWLCTTDADVRVAFCEAMFGDVASADGAEIENHMDWFKDPKQWDDAGWLHIRQNFEDGWLEVIDLGVKSVLGRPKENVTMGVPDRKGVRP